MSGRSLRTQPLAALLLLTVLFSQLIASAPGHSDDPATHCCPICHASHSPVLPAVAVAHLGVPQVRIYWRVAPDALPSLVEAGTPGDCTRGPPALSLAV